MKTRLLLFFLCLSAMVFAQLTIKVTGIPSSTPANESIFIAGNFQGWSAGDPNYKLSALGGGQYQIVINPPVGLVEYKFTRGSWATVEGTSNGGFLANRQYNYTGGAQAVEVQIAGWEDVSQGSTAASNVHLLDANFNMPQLNRSRRIMIYLPPDYETTQKRYPVLYMHDGQNLFDDATSFSGEWGVDESLNALHAQGDYGCIVVGIDNGGALRLDELAPWVNSDYNEGGEGALYLKFIVETLKPFIDSNYRTIGAREYTAIMGSSLGGLISQFGVMEHQDVFSKAGILSPAFWFNDPQIFDHSANTPKTGPMRIYQYAGQVEGNGSVEADVNHMETVLLGNGFGTGELYKSINPNGEHSEPYWREEFPTAYKWLFAGLDYTAANEVTPAAFRVYPNPADSVLYLENLPGQTKLTYRIYGIDGRLAKKGKLEGNTIAVDKLPIGSYVLNVFAKKQQVGSAKFLVN
ncbi:MAG: T9SS type A sorting domain-containing protein [Saprospiraceae bacterium]|nr:T9SS type A sorting domain-containing protein [Saprospiraceae bacterium]